MPENFQHINQSNENIGKVLQHVLRDMENCVAEQERIIVEERAAMKVFDGDQLAELVERRARCQSELSELESVCQRVVLEANVGDKFEALIDIYCTDDEADVLQSQRIELARRMQRLEEDHIENHIRLRAAWNVTTTILQQVGVVESQSTYQNVSYAPAHQVAR